MSKNDMDDLPGWRNRAEKGDVFGPSAMLECLDTIATLRAELERARAEVELAEGLRNTATAVLSDALEQRDAMAKRARAAEARAEAAEEEADRLRSTISGERDVILATFRRAESAEARLSRALEVLREVGAQADDPRCDRGLSGAVLISGTIMARVAAVLKEGTNG